MTTVLSSSLPPPLLLLVSEHPCVLVDARGRVWKVDEATPTGTGITPSLDERAQLATSLSASANLLIKGRRVHAEVDNESRLGPAYTFERQPLVR